MKRIFIIALQKKIVLTAFGDEKWEKKAGEGSTGEREGIQTDNAGNSTMQKGVSA